MKAPAATKGTRALVTVALAALLGGACSKQPSLPNDVNTDTTPATHSHFPITSGPHAVDCNTCHGQFQTFQQFTCTNCHGHEVQSLTDLLHQNVAKYEYSASSCYTCHQTGARQPFDHAGISASTPGGCAQCHAVGANFAALPQPGLTHIPITRDCGGCHLSTTTWKTSAAPGLTEDPKKVVAVNALVPTYAGTSISSVTPETETVTMPMNHQTTAVDPGVLNNCATCHTNSASASFYPGTFHTALAGAGVAQPATCVDCHGSTTAASAMTPPWLLVPTGFVGPLATNPARTPSTGEMKHDAVAWANGAPTTTALVSTECSTCHAAPTTAGGGWNVSKGGTTPALYHAALANSASGQPTSCVDCHANTTPVGMLTSATAALPPGVEFDHASTTADCATCHTPGTSTQWTSWTGGRFHLPGSATPQTCVPCHMNERPTTTTGWTGIDTATTNAPFDYVANAALGTLPHGDNQDCVSCHTGPGTGAWGSTQNWVGGRVDHKTNPAVQTTCIACHATQRPTVTVNFTYQGQPQTMNHTLNGQGDCIGCHEASVTAGTFANWKNPSTGGWPGGDWQGGQPFPGPMLVGSGSTSVSVTELTLVRSGANDLVTGTTSAQATLPQDMNHTSTGMPSALSLGTPGTSGFPDATKCWHCHTNDGASPTPTVTSWSNGRFHSALSSYTATPGGTVTPLAQPGAQFCNDCHANGRPSGIVEHQGSELGGMDHNAAFTAGSAFSSVADMQCGTCHAQSQPPGVSWTNTPGGAADGAFHANIAGSTPADCTTCHYPLEADTTAADKQNPPLYDMKHASAQVTIQNCESCHASALAASTTGTTAATWAPGQFHPNTPAQPTACSECHAVSEPAPDASTQSAHTYAIPNPADNPNAQTTSNGGQWMNHGSSALAGLDCVTCHASDAQPTGSAWSSSDQFHSNVTTPGSCSTCHGMANGVSGATDGDHNNIPNGLTDTSTVTSASSDPASGIPAGTHDQINHEDINVASRDCGTCHTQAGLSTVPGIQGHEWAQASFHAHFDASSPLEMNGTTGRCSNCHLSVKPGPSFTALDHTGFTDAPGTLDCSTCHTWPGTGTPSAPNWQGGNLIPNLAADPQKAVKVSALIPSYTGSAISAVTPATETLSMPMNHATSAVNANVIGNCATCHAGAASGAFYPGTFHPALATAGLSQPMTCAGCHGATAVAAAMSPPWLLVPKGFVGPLATNPARSPQSGEMKHDAVAWANGMPTTTALVSTECSTCHAIPAGSNVGWNVSTTGASPATYHSALTAAASQQPGSCIDCHANSRPSATLTSTTAALPQNVEFDHSWTSTVDCQSCHATGSSTQWTSWTGGRFHLPDSATPQTCLPCHVNERPTTTTGWTGIDIATTNTPFDYVASATQGTAPHGDNQDCVSCHAGPGTGAWGGTQNWVGGYVDHATNPAVKTTCISCHVTQRPTVLINFNYQGQPQTMDHTLNGLGDCTGCHEATVTAGSFVNWKNPSTGGWPGGDWQGGQLFPGSTPIGTGSQSVSVTEITLVRSGSNNLVTGTTSSQATLPQDMNHTSTGIPAALSLGTPGSAGYPDATKCWHCHTNDGASPTPNVTSWSNGQFHSALNNYTATPGGTIAPLDQPGAMFCNDCHANGRPSGIVEHLGSDLIGMDHNAVFVAGSSYTSVATMQCGVCHAQNQPPGQSWKSTSAGAPDGTFHANIAGSTPADCTTCHYPLEADHVAADTLNPPLYDMKHASAQVTIQNCESCHASALAAATSGTIASSWAPGTFHPNTPAQPTACSECHAVSEPAPAQSTQSAHVYTIANPADNANAQTASNGGQWMNHGSSALAGLDCVTCHASDAQASGSAWSKADLFHANVTSPGSCSTCHGTTNGVSGTSNGDRNNLPNGLTDSSTVTSAASDPTTGLSAGTHDQINHADINVSSRDCSSCHTQAGLSTVSGIQGHEWAQAKFHANVGTSSLVANGTTGRCSNCHLNVVPGPGFTTLAHASFTDTPGSLDCSTCHTWPGTGSASAPNWKGATAIPGLTEDPQKVVTASALLPTYAGTSISALTPANETLAMPMNHASTAVGSAVIGNCAGCHSGAASGTFYPGQFHASLAGLGVAQPSACIDCHGETAAAASMSPPWLLVPTGFVGPLATNPARAPASGEMKHDAVAWANGAPTTTALVSTECSTCHAAPAASGVGWSASRSGTAPAVYHAALTAASSAQPASCIDCHANSKPTGTLTSTNAVLPPNVEFDHSWTSTPDCVSCHSPGTSTQWTSWSGGKFHLAGSSTPQTCLPCHVNERPTTTTGWTGINIATTNTPFDYVANASQGTLPHGDNQDCVSCHAGPGTGAWGGTQNWVGGHVDHTTNPAVATSCIACHVTQRPTTVINFTYQGQPQTMDHTLNGQGDCSGCHEATVKAGTFANWKNPSTGGWPGGDWQGGQLFPGSMLIGSGTQSVSVTELALVRSGPNNLATGLTSSQATLPQDMNHASTGIPAALSLGTPDSPGYPDTTKCWHCHTNDGASPTPNVTSWSNGQFHSALNNYTATPGGAIAPLAQPGAMFCNDCHANGRPTGIVEHQGSDLIGMDHNAAFVSGSTYTSVADMQCGVCHAQSQPPGVAWASTTSGASDGVFHANIAGSTPADCTTCHYPLEADTAVADKQSPPQYDMKHASAQVTIQNCETCHASALTASTSGSTAAKWAPGQFHPNTPAQPAACNDCHAVSEPAPNQSTQSAHTYAIPNPVDNANAQTLSNGGQWMNHGSSALAGLDCASCHASDAKTSGSAWSSSDQFHPSVSSPGSCATCHGLTNGVSGATDGDHNNIPNGLTDSSTITSAASDPGTGISASTHDQINHADINVSSHDCSTCHTQAGLSTVSGVQGHEWAQAKFHANVGGSALVMNGTTGRCSDCHMNVVPGSGFTALPHASFSDTPGTLDCSMCHTWPGTGSASAPNWKGATVIPSLTEDPQKVVTLTALVPTWSGSSIAAVTPSTETLTMPMNHASTAVSAAVLDNCSGCHAGAASGTFYPGTFHASLTSLGKAQPSTCVDCHGDTVVAATESPPWLLLPKGFVGPTATSPARTPASGEMRHEAVAWSNGAPTTTLLVSTECSTCHAAPAGAAGWNFSRSGTTPAVYHAALTAASGTQPTSCIDCHANSRPSGALTSSNAALPQNVQFDHSWTTTSDCVSCHSPGTPTQWTAWTGGKFHLAGSSTPQTCLPCHVNERPTSTTGWTGINVATTNAPFDYVANASLGTLPHGDNQDCVSCHAGPGTGAWGGTQNWVGGHVDHTTNPAVATSCIACHVTQRPTVVVNFTDQGQPQTMDHTQNGQGDCIGCHAATVKAGTFANWKNPSTGGWPGGDWQGGLLFPGSTLIGTGSQSITVTELTLDRSGSNNLVTAFTSSQVTLPQDMNHASTGMPAALSLGTPGTSGYPDVTKCWHCHTNDGASPTPNVTSWSNGQFHSALNNYTATPGGAITPLAQPGAMFCNDCHATGMPSGIVEHKGSDLIGMDHNALFTAGSAEPSVADMQCGVCHAQNQAAGLSWSDTALGVPDGLFHVNIAGSTPADCTTCHYPLEADGPAADTLNPPQYDMKHASTQVTIQNCESCHRSALGQATTGTTAAKWAPGQFHPNTPAQPGACSDCHAVSEPAANQSTQSAHTYTISSPTSAQTSSNGAQWMNHGSSALAGLDCAVCHASDAQASGSAWSKADLFHAHVSSSGSCITCHGLANGVGGTTDGLDNNLPNGLSDSSIVTSAASDPTTGVPAGTHDQINHADINVSSRDCGSCHTQAGISSTPGIQGHEWAQASFHANVSNASLVMNGTTGRCSDCHMSVLPGPGFTVLEHSGFTDTPGTLDCSTCHTWPGTGTSSAPNWKGANLIPGLTEDPTKVVTVAALIPTYSGTSISTVTPASETLTMPMNHNTSAISASVIGNCANCHAGAATGTFYPGNFHTSLTTLGITQPSACIDCHGDTSVAAAMSPPWLLLPKGFVGPLATNPVRTPSTGEMKHDAVAWTNGVPTAATLVSTECSTCHAAPTTAGVGWNVSRSGTTPAVYHAALTAASSAQPTSCIDCHANSKPPGTLTSLTAALPPNVEFDHSWTPTPDCVKCHSPGGSTQWTSWTEGKFHLSGSSTPQTCLPCHVNERPTTTTGWTGINVATTNAPFDYVANASQGILPHGDSQDCVNCHAGPGTGVWGTSQNWVGGHVDHTTNPAAATTCIACHATQRPTTVINFTYQSQAQTMDHTQNGLGDCIGCHEATVKADAFANWKNPSTGSWPGGDWQGGQPFPGSQLIGSGTQSISVTEITLQRSGPNNLVTGETSTMTTLYNEMLHTSAAMPAALNLGTPGTSGYPDTTKCWHCHTNDGASPTPNVTSWVNGQFHTALNNYTATPGGTITPLAQPTAALCTDCHSQMRPTGIVEFESSDLIAMDHNAAFSSGPVAAVTEMPCGACHAQSQPPGVSWTNLPDAGGGGPDGVFHANIAGSTPGDCTTCHYPLEANTAVADVTSGTLYAMKHAAPEVTIQNCQLCHAAALAAATGGAQESAWKPGAFHPNTPSQPSACNDCHLVSEPASNASTQSAYTYTIANPTDNANAQTGSNGPQWMNHGSSAVAGLDCATCHASDAKASGSAWSKSDQFHTHAAATTCSSCHGVTNGVSSSTPGTNNNMPYGLTDSSTVTTAASDPTTGVPTGTHDQITHADLNVSTHECSFCHTQSGLSTTPGIQGHEWAQAKFHTNFNASSPLVTNGTTARCSNCHLNVTPGAGFTPLSHVAFTDTPGSQDCSSCHTWPGAGGLSAPNWKGAVGAPDLAEDPKKDVTVSALVPTYSGTTIAQVTPASETLVMPMNHNTTEVDATAMASCSNCHASASSGVYYPGTLHSALANLSLPQPTQCSDCHGNVTGAAAQVPAWQVVPTGFVGPTATNPARSPASGEMKHDAVAWAAGVPTTTSLVSTECGTCHASASTTNTAWDVSLSGTTPAVYHPALTAASQAQPTSCIDCHANTEPTTTLTSSNSALPANLEFNHTWTSTPDCVSCHSPGGPTQWTSWSGGKFHLPGSSTPQTCLPCHTNERPTTTTGWTGINVATTNSPFDYVANASIGELPHGAGQDCVMCHAGPGTGGTWGSTQNWTGGAVNHATNPIAEMACISCHVTQRPTVAISFTYSGQAMTMDHTQNGLGDCIGCHDATAKAGTFVNWKNPSTGSWPGGDWQNGAPFPGSTLVGSGLQSITVNEITLQRSGTYNLVTGMTTAATTLYNEMLHTSAGIPSALDLGTPGTSGYPDTTKCWHCHTNDGASPVPNVTSWVNGEFHTALNSYTATVGGTVTPLAQPTATECADCHAQMRPTGIVEADAGVATDAGTGADAGHADAGHSDAGTDAGISAGSDLIPMDHNATFTAGSVYASVTAMPCGSCHAQNQQPGVSWLNLPSNAPDGVFHKNIPGNTPSDCTTCHYPLEADSTLSDVTSGTNYKMVHGSAQMQIQNCELCHTTALANATTGTASTLWKTGTFHPNTPTQPTACNDCHLVSEPKSNRPTQSTVTYTIPNPSDNSGAQTTTNGAQWMNHGATSVTGLDCVKCHASDAKASGSAWSKSDLFHPNVTGLTACSVCHGLSNGNGSTVGTKNNMPNGLTDSTYITTASNDSTTGVAAGTHDQITHTDVNVTGHDCNFCHTQQGTSTVTGIQGHEWAQGTFHANFSTANPLLMDGATGRCSNCHLNVLPGSNFTPFNHTGLSNVSGTQDCSSCHYWPGGGGTGAPDWTGASVVPAYINVGGFNISEPPETSVVVEPNIANLPHPNATPSGCTTCHTTGTYVAPSQGGTAAAGYDHASAAENNGCNSCHEAGTNLLSTGWNGSTTQAGAAGDSRPYTLTSVRAYYSGDSCNVTYANHFYPVDCYQCHTPPTGIAFVTTGTTYLGNGGSGRWTFPHKTSDMTNPTTCNMCHTGSCGM